jgi:hypothetical protein
MVHVAQDTEALLATLADLDSIKPPTATLEEPLELIATVGKFVDRCTLCLETDPKWRRRRRPLGQRLNGAGRSKRTEGEPT